MRKCACGRLRGVVLPRMSLVTHRAFVYTGGIALPRPRTSSLMEMDEWPVLRLRRATRQPIACERIETTEDSCFLFTVRSSTGKQRYIVEIYEDVDGGWPPRCTCEDACWRPEVLCKHQVYCLKMMGAPSDRLTELFWEPSQEEMYDLLMCAPDVLCENNEVFEKAE